MGQATCFEWVLIPNYEKEFGVTGRELSQGLGLTPANIHFAIARHESISLTSLISLPLLIMRNVP